MPWTGAKGTPTDGVATDGPPVQEPAECFHASGLPASKGRLEILEGRRHDLSSPVILRKGPRERHGLLVGGFLNLADARGLVDRLDLVSQASHPAQLSVEARAPGAAVLAVHSQHDLFIHVRVDGEGPHVCPKNAWDMRHNRHVVRQASNRCEDLLGESPSAKRGNPGSHHSLRRWPSKGSGSEMAGHHE